MVSRRSSFFCFLFFLASVVAFPAKAFEAPVRPCNGCTYMQQEQLAHGFAMATGINHFYIYDLSNSSIHLWEVWVETEVIPGEVLLISDRYTPHPQIVDYFNMLSFVYQESNGSMVIEVNHFLGENGSNSNLEILQVEVDASTLQLDGQAFDSAYEFISSPSAHVQLSQHVMSKHGRWVNPVQVLFSSANLGLRIFYNEPFLAVGLTVVFQDGSTLLIRFNETTNRFEYVPGSARDSNGNIIPDGPADFVGPTGNRVFEFPVGSGDGNITRFLHRASMYGIPIGGPSNRRRIGCVRSGEHAPISCESF